MKLREAVGGTIRKIRTEQGLTLREVASRRYIAVGYLSELERGHKDASSEVLDNIANALDMTTLELLKEIYEYLEEHNG